MRLRGTGAGAVLRRCSVEVLVTESDGRVLGDMSGAGAYGQQGVRWVLLVGAVWGIADVASS